MRNPFEMLMADHRLIERVLVALESAPGSGVGFGFYERAVEFVAHFADDMHHAREEDLLFPRLVERGIPEEYGPVGVMLEEHCTGRAHIRAMRESLRARDLPALEREARGYVALMRDHIAKEDQVLFPMGAGVLAADVQARIAKAFDALPPPPGGHAHYVELADALLAEVGAVA